MDYTQIANALVSGLVALCCLNFAIIYHLHAPWRSTPFGRHLMTFTLSIGALATYTVLITVWPDGWAADVLRFARILLLLFIAGLVLQRTRMVLAAQHKGGLTQVPRSDRHNSEH
jgi:hypothetical protein